MNYIMNEENSTTKTNCMTLQILTLYKRKLFKYFDTLNLNFYACKC